MMLKPKYFISTTIIMLLLGTGIFVIKLREFVIQTTLQPTLAVQEPWIKKLKSYYYKVFNRSSVFQFLRNSYYIFGIPKKGLIHIGARYAEELDYYLEHGINDLLWIEADIEAEAKLKQAVAKHSGSKVAIFAATDTNGTINLHQTSNSGHSSSILALKNHRAHYPDIVANKTMAVTQRKLDDYLALTDKEKYNIIVIDVQGAELIALRGQLML